MARKRAPAVTLTPAVADRLFEGIMSGRSVRSICDDEGMPSKTSVMRWLAADEEFAARYAAAKAIQAELLADEMIAIADTPEEGTKTIQKATGTEITTGDMVEHRKLRISTRQWMLARLLPKKYGDRIQQEITGRDGGPVVIAGAPSDADL